MERQSTGKKVVKTNDICASSQEHQVIPKVCLSSVWYVMERNKPSPAYPLETEQESSDCRITQEVEQQN